MPKHVIKKIKLVPKKPFFIFFLVAFATIGSALFLVINRHDSGPSETVVNVQADNSNRCLRISGDSQCVLDLEVVDTDEKRIQGLSGRDRLPEKSGMLFEFDQPSRQCFWMKDMKFAIDMIWIDGNFVITKIEKNIKPESYPDQFCSIGLDQYVLEVNSGVSDNIGLSVGKSLSLR